MHTINLITFVLVILAELTVIESAALKKSNLFQSVDENNKRVNVKGVTQAHARIFFDQLSQVTGVMFPIEINVPDSIMGMMNGLMVMWDAMQEYLSTENSVVPRIATLLRFIL